MYRCDGEQRGEIFKKINAILSAKLTLKSDREQKREKEKTFHLADSFVKFFRHGSNLRINPRCSSICMLILVGDVTLDSRVLFEPDVLSLRLRKDFFIKDFLAAEI